MSDEIISELRRWYQAKRECATTKREADKCEQRDAMLACIDRDIYFAGSPIEQEGIAEKHQRQAGKLLAALKRETRVRFEN